MMAVAMAKLISVPVVARVALFMLVVMPKLPLQLPLVLMLVLVLLIVVVAYCLLLVACVLVCL